MSTCDCGGQFDIGPDATQRCLSCGESYFKGDEIAMGDASAGECSTCGCEHTSELQDCVSALKWEVKRLEDHLYHILNGGRDALALETEIKALTLRCNCYDT